MAPPTLFWLTCTRLPLHKNPIINPIQIFTAIDSTRFHFARSVSTFLSLSPVFSSLANFFMAAFAPRGIICQLRSKRRPVASPPLARRIVVRDSSSPAPIPPSQSQDQVKIVLQPRLCTLRSYGSDRGGVIRTKIGDSSRPEELSPFLANLLEYVESTKRSQDFETISGRFAMVVFAATLGIEFTTGNSVFRKMDLQGIEEAAGVCIAAVASAALFAWFTSNRTRVRGIFTTSCNTFIDSLIDNIIDGLFYDTDLSEWTDDV